MIYEQAIDKIKEALNDIETGERVFSEALPKDTDSLHHAAIAQAKLLAVIASVLTEMKEAYFSTHQF